MRDYKKYWLRGGIVMGAFHLAWIFLMMFEHYRTNIDTTMSIILIDFPIFAISGLVTSVANPWLESFPLFFLFFGILGTIMYFLVGSLIGLAYGKIKEKLNE